MDIDCNSKRNIPPAASRLLAKEEELLLNPPKKHHSYGLEASLRENPAKLSELWERMGKKGRPAVATENSTEESSAELAELKMIYDGNEEVTDIRTDNKEITPRELTMAERIQARIAERKGEQLDPELLAKIQETRARNEAENQILMTESIGEADYIDPFLTSLVDIAANTNDD